MAKSKEMARRFAELDDKPVRDYDPEAEAPEQSDGLSGSEDSEDEDAGTEHYVSVGKSKLRQKEAAALGPQYQGTRVSRAALEEESDDDDVDDEESSNYEDAQEELDQSGEEFDDPETADLEADHVDDDAEIESDDALGESDEERFKDYKFRGSSLPNLPKGKKGRPTAADFLGSDEDDESISDAESESDGGAPTRSELRKMMNGDMDGDENDSEGSDEDTDEDEDEEDDEEDEDNSGSDDDQDAASSRRAQLLEIMGDQNKSAAATLSQAAKGDIAKGMAARQQRRAFDSLLNIRIRLQKALVAVNSIHSIEDASANAEPYEGAEAAAVKLWNAIDSFRMALQPEADGKAGRKRKREIGLETSSEDIWQEMEKVEEKAAAHRRKVLEKWSNREKNTSVTPSGPRLRPTAPQRPFTSVLDDQLTDMGRLVKRTRTPRSCAPAQVARKVDEDPEIYDDADFYQMMLKELVDQRTMDTSSAGGQVATIQWAAVKEAKTKKHVDTRASKGRKLRFTVHEKLQNFMAPEDRRSWEQDAIDRFFGTLFGQKMALNEDEVSDDEMNGVDVEEAGLRLFRS